MLIVFLFQRFKFTYDYPEHKTKILIPEHIVMDIYKKEKQLIFDQLEFFDSCNFQSILLLQIAVSSFIFSEKIIAINIIYNNILNYIASQKIFLSSQKITLSTQENFSSSRIKTQFFDSAENQFLDFIKNSFRANKLFNENLTGKDKLEIYFQDRSFNANINCISKFNDLINLCYKKDLILLGNFENQIDIFGLIFTQFKERITFKYESGYTNIIIVLNNETNNNLLLTLQDILRFTDVDYSIILKNHNTLETVNLDKTIFLKDLIYFKNFILDISDLYKNDSNTNYLLSSKSIYYKIEPILKCEIYLGTDIFLDQYFQNSPKIYCYIIKLKFSCFYYTFNIFFAD